jgi:hypothetical protein
MPRVLQDVTDDDSGPQWPEEMTDGNYIAAAVDPH